MTIALLLSAVMLGLVSAPHCVAMCGGIVTAAQLGRDSTPQSPKRRLPMSGAGIAVVAAQNAGRITAYAFAGLVAGGVGAVFGQVGVSSAREVLRFTAAGALLLAGASLMGVVPARASIERIGLPLWRRLQPVAKRLFPIDTWQRGLLFGMVWGFVPCGLVYSALSFAMLSGSALSGATTMIAFGLGTAPALFAMGTVATALASFLRRTAVRRGAGVALLVFGLCELGLVVRSVHAAGRGHSCCPHPATAQVQLP